MMNQIIDANELARNNYTEYSKYVSSGRAYPQVYDGLKSSYRRALYGMWEYDSGKIVKLADLAAHALPYHPHPSSISGVIVQLGENGNKLKIMNTQGNWGDSTKGIIASADRYIGGKLSSLAKHLLLDSVEYCEFVPGEIDKPEPKALPALLPLCFINGSSGIPSGLPTLNIPTLDIIGMLDYYIEVLQAKDTSYRPKKLPKPNLEINMLSTKEEWDNVLLTGKGMIKTAPIMSINQNNVITITAIPKDRSIEHVRKVVEKEILLDKIDVRDESTDKLCIVIEKVPHKQCDMKELYKKLYTKLQANETYNMAFYDEEKIYVPCSFHKVVQSNIDYLIKTHQNRITKQLEQVHIKLRVLEVIEEMKKGNILKSLFDCEESGAITFIVDKYKVTTDIASKVLQKPLSYLTKEHYQEIIDLQQQINELETDQSDIYEFLIRKYKALKKEINSIIKNKFIPTTFIKS